MVAEESLFCITAQMVFATTVFSPVAGQEFLGEQDDILFAFTERRHHHRHHLDSEIEVFPEAFRLDRFFEIHMRRTDDAHIYGDFAVVAYARNMLFLQHAEELHLHIQRKFADFIEKNRSTIGLLEKALACFDGSRKGTLGVSEQERFHQVLRDGAAVHRNKGLVGTRAMAMDIFCNDFLARSRFATDNHRHRKDGQLIS